VRGFEMCGRKKRGTGQEGTLVELLSINHDGRTIQAAGFFGGSDGMQQNRAFDFD